MKKILFVLAAAVLSGCGTSYYNRYEPLQTEGEIVRVCSTTADEARRWMDVCRKLQGQVHRMDTGQECIYTGVAGADLRYAYDEWTGDRTLVSSSCGTTQGDFMCEVAGSGCPIDGVYQQLGASE